MTTVRQPFWHPLVAGIALGGVLLLTFLLSGHGLGASGFVTRLAAGVSGVLAPAWSAANAYFGPYFGEGVALLNSWIGWEALGVLIGALAGSMVSGRFRAMIERGAGKAATSRLAYAFAGGVLVGFGARLARGCTSGLGLSGSATLAVAGFVFLLAFFAAGFAASYLMRGRWQ